MAHSGGAEAFVVAVACPRGELGPCWVLIPGGKAGMAQRSRSFRGGRQTRCQPSAPPCPGVEGGRASQIIPGDASNRARGNKNRRGGAWQGWKAARKRIEFGATCRDSPHPGSSQTHFAG